MRANFRGWRFALLLIFLAPAVVVVTAIPYSHAQHVKTIYLAGPLGFSEAGRLFVTQALSKELERLGYRVINPFDLPDKNRIKTIQDMPAGEQRIEAWRKFNEDTGKGNREAIDSCDIVIAVLDGPDVDSGTASEIGYAFARGKPVVGYRGDFRLSSDNEGGIVNLQVEYFIRASGGDVVRKIEQLPNALAKLSK
jgi:nucleoside 2-deoxyribosyltransferase